MPATLGLPSPNTRRHDFQFAAHEGLGLGVLALFVQIAVQSVTTFCTFSYEFSSFGFDSWAAVVIIE